MVSDALLQALVNTCIGRFGSYTVQQENGRYRRVFDCLTYDLLRAHLGGELTLGTYPITEYDVCRFAVFDADGADGLFQMVQLQQMLGELRVPSYLEESRRGAHLRVFLQSPLSPALVRRALLPSCPTGVEFFPAQDTASFEHPGYAIRVPLGVHRKSGQRYPFVEVRSGSVVPYASTLEEMLLWLSMVSRVSSSVLSCLAGANDQPVGTPRKNPLHKKLQLRTRVVRAGDPRWESIEHWNAEQDPFALIGRYVDLNAKGEGHCPFGWHHSDGVDRHPSLVVYQPSVPGAMCWYCRAWGQGGSAFDFLKFYYGLSPCDLWHRILCGEQF